MKKNSVSLFGLLIRGWKKRCPSCGEGRIFSRWIDRYDHCSSCGYRYEENEGDLWAFWVFSDRFFVVAALAAGLILSGNTGLSPLMEWFVRGSLFLVIAFFLIVTMPQRLGCCIAFECWLRSLTPNKD